MKSKNDNFIKQINIRLNENEKEIIKSKALKAGLSMSDYMRKTALKLEITARVDNELVGQIRKIGINLNQVVRKINSLIAIKNSEHLFVELNKNIADIEGKLKEIIKILG